MIAFLFPFIDKNKIWKTDINNKQVKSKLEEKPDYKYKKAVSESKKKKVEKNNNDVTFKKILTNDEALALIKEKLGTKKEYKFEGIAVSDLECISSVFRTSKTLYVVNLYNGQIADANTGEIYVPVGT